MREPDLLQLREHCTCEGVFIGSDCPYHAIELPPGDGDWWRCCGRWVRYGVACDACSSTEPSP